MSALGDKVAAAKLWLVSETGAALPYLASAVYALVLVPSHDVPRMSADERWRLYANPDWAAEADVEEVAAEIAHTAWHLLLEHADRARGIGVGPGTARAWTRATDLTVDHTLRPDGLTCRHLDLTGATDPRVRRLGRDRSAEEYFAVLSDLPVDGGSPERGSPDGSPPEDDLPDCGSAADGIARSHDLPPDLDDGSLDRADRRALLERVAIDYTGHVTTRGSEPGEAGRWARMITDPELPWEALLARAVRRAAGWTTGRGQWTYNRPSRRASSLPGVVLPGLRRPVPGIAMVVDTSGSIDDALLGKAMGEVEGALGALGVAGAAVTVVACDAAVGAVRRVRRSSDAALVGGGGTDLRVGIATAARQRPRPDVLVVLTDGFTPWPSAPPAGMVTVVALLGRAADPFPPTPEWAMRVECRL